MTYCQVGQRGGQPFYNGHQTLVQKPQASLMPTGQFKNGLKFGGSLAKSSIDGSVAVFQKINEVFIVGFITQDGFGMFAPRIGTSLKVGREPYDPYDDPQAQNLPFDQQIKKWVVGTVKGLNWVNFNEGAKREAATGPGLLAMPAAIFLANRYFGNPSQELSYRAMKNLGAGFKAHLASQHDVKAYKSEVRNYIRSIFIDPDLQAGQVGSKHVNLDRWCQEWTDALFRETSKGRWERMQANFKSPPPLAKDKPVKSLEALAEQLHTQIRDFNRNERVLAYNKPQASSKFASFIADKTPLHSSDQVWVSYQPKAKDAGKYVEQVPISKVTEELKRFGWYAKQVLDKSEIKQSGAALAKSAEKTAQEMIGRKFMLAVGTTVISALYLMKLAFWAQSHGTYQAVRLFQEDHKTKKSHHKHQLPQSAPLPATNAPFVQVNASQQFQSNGNSAFQASRLSSMPSLVPQAAVSQRPFVNRADWSSHG